MTFRMLVLLQCSGRLACGCCSTVVIVPAGVTESMRTGVARPQKNDEIYNSACVEGFGIVEEDPTPHQPTGDGTLLCLRMGWSLHFPSFFPSFRAAVAVAASPPLPAPPE